MVRAGILARGVTTVGVVFAALLSSTLLSPAAVSAAPATPSVPTITRVVPEGPQQYAAYVYSVAMAKEIKVQILVPRHETGPRPVLYMLSGLGEQDPQNSIWLIKSDAKKFFADKNVTVALPLAGNGSFYTDWLRDDPKLGRYRWETFLTKELPPLVNARFSGNGRQGIAGLSMGAGSSLILGSRHPGFYSSLAAYSGCFTTTGVAGQGYVRAIVRAFGGNADNMWGAPDNPQWAAHDVVMHANGLRGSTVYVSVGTGRSGRYDAPGYPGNTNPTDRQIVGGGIEAGALYCTRQLQDQTTRLGVPATFVYDDPGTHSWPYWVDQLHRSWPTVARGLGVA